MTIQEKRQEFAEMILQLTDEEMAEYIRLLNEEINADRFPLITRSEATA